MSEKYIFGPGEYATVGGGKAVIFSDQHYNGDYHLIGAIYDADLDGWEAETWTETGRYCQRSPSNDDLKPPVTVTYAAVAVLHDKPNPIMGNEHAERDPCTFNSTLGPVTMPFSAIHGFRGYLKITRDSKQRVLGVTFEPASLEELDPLYET